MKYKVKDLASVSSSKRIFAREYSKKGIPFYRGKEISLKADGRKIEDSLFISFERYKQIIENYDHALLENDILITAVGTIGNIYQIQKSDLPFYFKDGNIIKISNFRQDVVNPSFLAYWFKSYAGQTNIKEIKIGSTQQAITIKEVAEMEIDLPALSIQRNIADNLTKLDKKIEINNGINDNLAA